MDRWDQVRVTSLALRSKTDEVADGQDVVATGAPAAESQLATHQIASVTSSFSQEAFLTGGTFVYRLSDQPLLPTQCVGEIGECRSVRLPVAESEGSLAAGWATIDAAALDRKGPAAHWTDSNRRLGIVTRIVTRGDRAHAPTACASVGARASSRTN